MCPRSSARGVLSTPPISFSETALGATLCCAVWQYPRLLHRPPAKAEPLFIPCGLIGNRHGQIAAAVTSVCFLNDKVRRCGRSPHRHGSQVRPVLQARIERESDVVPIGNVSYGPAVLRQVCAFQITE